MSINYKIILFLEQASVCTMAERPNVDDKLEQSAADYHGNVFVFSRAVITSGMIKGFTKTNNLIR